MSYFSSVTIFEIENIRIRQKFNYKWDKRFSKYGSHYNYDYLVKANILLK